MLAGYLLVQLEMLCQSSDVEKLILESSFRIRDLACIIISIIAELLLCDKLIGKLGLNLPCTYGQ